MKSESVILSKLQDTEMSLGHWQRWPKRASDSMDRSIVEALIMRNKAQLQALRWVLDMPSVTAV